MRRTAAALALALGGLTVVGPAYAAPPGGGAGCKEFGNNVAVLAQTFDFGTITSGNAQDHPRAVTEVIRAEKARCD